MESNFYASHQNANTFNFNLYTLHISASAANAYNKIHYLAVGKQAKGHVYVCE
jgi:hypothetical protein